MSECDQLVEKIRQEQAAGRLILPSLPEVAVRIRNAVNDENANLKHIVKLVQMDPGIAARLIQIANSPINRTSQPIEDCLMAVNRLGLATTKNLVTCLVLHDTFKCDNDLIRQHIQQLWKQSCHVAAIAAVIAKLIPGLNQDKALLAGLLHGIGELPILYYAVNFPTIIASKDKLNYVINHLKTELGNRILEAWHFDEDIKHALVNADNWLRDTGNDVDYADIIIISRIHSFFGSGKQEVPALMDVPAFQKLSLSKLGPDASMEVLYAAEQDIRRVMAMLH